MIIHFYFKKVTREDKEKLKNYLTDKKLKRLTRLLQHGNLELCNFFIQVEYFSHHNAFSVKLDLKIIEHKLFSEEKSHNLIKAFDLAFDSLINQLRKIENLTHKLNK